MKDFSTNNVIAALADPTRRALFEQLAQTPLLVGELAQTTDVSRSAVSQHLRVLREANLVNESKSGRQVRYAVDLDTLKNAAGYLNGLLETAAVHTAQKDERKSSKPARETLTRLQDPIDMAMLQWSHWALNFDPKVLATIARMRLLSDNLEEKYRKVAGRFGLVTGEAIILGTLKRVDGPKGITPRDLARVSVIAPPSLAKHLRTLERKGLIERENHPVDRRSHRVKLTRKGCEVADTVTHEQLSRHYAVLFALPENTREVLDTIFKQMLIGLQATR